MNRFWLMLLCLLSSSCSRYHFAQQECDVEALLAAFSTGNDLMLAAPAANCTAIAVTLMNNQSAMSVGVRGQAPTATAAAAGLERLLRDLSELRERLTVQINREQQLARENVDLKAAIAILEQRIAALKRIDERLEQQIGSVP